jgi:hypothetical protein
LIVWRGERLRIERTISDDLVRAARLGSFAVVGEPGIGKSSLLAQLATQLDRDATVVLLRAGEFAAQSVAELRGELSLDHEMVDVFRSGSSDRPGYLIIDALDATRGDQGKATAIRQLITAVRSLGSQWTVIASIRQFDLLWSGEWRRLFQASTKQTGELSDVMHVLVGPLDDLELTQLSHRASDLAAIVFNAPASLQSLLRVPFNLRLAAELGLDADYFREIRSQLDLLDRYWRERVENGVGGEARARAMCEVAVAAFERRTTRVPRTAVSDSSALEQLEHQGVVLRSRDFIEIAHHVVLDYAISRCVFGTSRDATQLVTPGMAVFYRQSFVMWLESLWANDRTRFWSQLSVLMAAHVPGAARVVVAELLVSKAEDVTELAPLLAMVSSEKTRGGIGTATFRFVHGAMLDERLSIRSPISWIHFIKTSSRNANGTILWHAARLLEALLRSGRVSGSDRLAGDAGRALLEAAWQDPQVERHLVGWSARCVLRSFDASVEQSASILGLALVEGGRLSYAADVISLMAEGIEALFVAPALVRDVYVTVFVRDAEASKAGYESAAPSRSDDSSLQRPDPPKRWATECWKLSEEFGEFFNASPEHATRAVARSARDSLRLVPLHKSDRVTITVLGRHYDVDDWSIASEMSGGTRELDSLIDRFSAILIRLGTVDIDAGQRLLEVLVEEFAPPPVWGALFRASIGNPNSFAFLSALLEPTLFRLLAMPVAEWLGATRLVLTGTQKLQVAGVIDKISQDSLGSYAQTKLRRALLDGEIGRQSDVVASYLGREDIGNMLLAERGMSPQDIQLPENVEIRQLEQRSDETRARLQREPNPKPEIIRECVESLGALVLALNRNAAHEAQIRAGWGTAAQLATELAKCGVATTLDALLAASTKPEPFPDPKFDAQFAKNPGWGGGFARIEAAQGLIVHAEKWATDSAIVRLFALRTDPSPVVRFHVARAMRVILRTHPDLAWGLFGELSIDANASVADATLDNSWVFYHTDQDRAVTIVRAACDRAEGAMLSDRVVSHCWLLLAFMYIQSGNRFAGRIVDDLVAKVQVRPIAIEQLLHDLRGALSSTTPPDARVRAVSVFRRLAVSIAEALTALGASDASINAPLREERHPLSRLAAEIAHQLYFASGAFVAPGEDVMPPEHRLRILDEFGDTMSLIGSIGATEASDRILDTLDEYVRSVAGVDAARLLPMFLQIARAAVAHGYQFGWNGFDVIDRTVRWYIAENPRLLADPPNIEALSSIMDAFLDAGWPSAFRLARDLSELR